MAQFRDIAVRIRIVNPRTIEQFTNVVEAAESLAEDLPWRDEPQMILDGLQDILDNIDAETIE